MFSRHLLTGLALTVFAVPVAAQQQSESYRFLQAVKDSKGDDVEKILNTPGTTVINTRDRDTGEGALHIVAKRGDSTYLRYLLGRGADANLRDADGDTPMMAAISAGYSELIDILANAHGNVNLGNRGGETPLIVAVHRRDLDLIRTLLADGADPDQRDHLQGLSAREYAHQDTRGAAIAKIIDDTPKKTKAAVAGPKF